MTFNVIIEAEAERDWAEAVNWYEERETGVGIRFDRAIVAFLKTLSREPERFPFVTRLARKAKMPEPWPYSVYFVANNKLAEVKILAIWHGARGPRKLGHRLK